MIEAAYLATAAVIAWKADWQQSAGFQVAANAVATGKLLSQAGITGWAASKEWRQQRKAEKESNRVSLETPTTVFTAA